MLTPQREKFAAGLASGLTQAAAHRKAFPRSVNWKDETVWRKASLLAANGEVRARVAELTSKAASANEVTVERVVRELARLAFFDVRKLHRDDGEPIPVQDLDDDTAAAIVGIESATERGRDQDAGTTVIRKYKLADKGANLERLGRHLKMFIDRVELSGSVALADAIVAARSRAKR